MEEKYTLLDIVNKMKNDDTVIDWNGINVKIKFSLSLKDSMEFVDYVTKMCFGDGGEYTPEIRDFATKVCLVEKYTDLLLPDDASERYFILYNSDLINVLLEHINENQFEEMLHSIDIKINYIAQSNIEAVNTQLQAVYNEFENLVNQFEKLFSEVSPEDMKSLFGALTGGTIDEEKFIKSYLEQSKDISDSEQEK